MMNIRFVLNSLCPIEGTKKLILIPAAGQNGRNIPHSLLVEVAVGNAVRVLCIGHDRLLLQTRKMVLAQHYSVDLATTVDELGSGSAGENVALVVLCHSLSRQERVLAARMVKQTWPEARLLEVLSGRENQPENDESEAVLGLDGPAALLEKAASLLSSRPRAESISLVRRRSLGPAIDIESRRNFFGGQPV